MRVLASLMAVALLSAACAPGESPSPAPSALPTPTLVPTTSPASPAPTPGSSPSPTSVTTAGCPAHSPLSVDAYLAALEADPTCFGDGDVSLLGWSGPWPEGIGWLAPGVEPSWLALSTSAIWQGKCPGSKEGCGEAVSVHIDPEAGLDWKNDGRWLVVSGHTNDPRAEGCHPVVSGDMTKAQARAECRRAFVLTSVRTASAALRANSFARVVTSELNVRAAPSTSAKVLEEGHSDAPPTKIRYGTTSGIDDVFVLDGPIKADGYRWWKVLPTEYVWDTDQATGKPITLPKPSPDPDFAGWVADGDGGRDWLVAAANPCPDEPVETADVTLKAASWAIRFGCFQGRTLTFKGWSDEAYSIFPTKRTMSDPENHDRLDFRVFPATLTLPPPGQWFEITGQFDHPSSASCEAFEVLECRSTFTATSVVALGP